MEEPMLATRRLALALVLAVAAPCAALGQQKLKFAHVYETSEPYHAWALWAAGENAYYQTNSNKPIAAVHYGVRHTTANKPIVRPEDMKGLKLRVPDAPLYIMYPKVVGANATPIAFAEVYLALQNGTVDAQENPLPTIFAKKFYEVQSHINLTGHITEMLFVIVSGPLWSRLSLGEREVFEDVFREACAKATAEIAASEIRLVDEFAKIYGKTVVKSDRAAFKRAFAKFLVGPDVAWDKALYDKVQALK